MAQQILATNTFTTAKWIVSALASDGTHTTITAAMASASSGDTIFIRPGTYTESFTWKAGVDLVAYTADAIRPNVTIIGTVSTGAASGTWSASGIRFQTNGGYAIDGTGAGTKATNFYNCYFNATNFTPLNNEGTTGTMNLYYCNGDLGTTGIALYDQQSNMTLSFNYCNFTNSGGSTTAAAHTVGDIIFNYSTIYCPITTHAQVTIHAYYSTIDCSAINTTCINLQALGSAACIATIRNCRFLSGTASALSINTNNSMTIYLSDINSSNTNAITGSGGISYAGLTFSGTSQTINTTTQTIAGTLQGSTTTAPTAGMIGERISSYQSSAVTISFSTVAQAITSISLTPGVWDVSCLAQLVVNGATLVDARVAINTSVAVSNEGDNMSFMTLGLNGVYDGIGSIPAYRYVFTTTTTVYLVGQVNFSVTNPKMVGRISAVRVA